MLNKTEKEFDIKDIYTPLSVAKKEIWRRLVPTPKYVLCLYNQK